MKCPECKGTCRYVGLIKSEPCGTCGGSGTIRTEPQGDNYCTDYVELQEELKVPRPEPREARSLRDWDVIGQLIDQGPVRQGLSIDAKVRQFVEENRSDEPCVMCEAKAKYQREIDGAFFCEDHLCFLPPDAVTEFIDCPPYEFIRYGNPGCLLCDKDESGNVHVTWFGGPFVPIARGLLEEDGIIERLPWSLKRVASDSEYIYFRRTDMGDHDRVERDGPHQVRD